MAEKERQAKLLLREQQSEAWLVELRKFDIRRFRLAIGLLTGHWRVNYHLSKMRLNSLFECKWFHVEEETTEHLLCEFQELVGLRQNLVWSAYPGAGQLEELDLGRLAFLAERINRKLG